VEPEPATAADATALAETFALAFARDPMTVWRRPTATPEDLTVYYRKLIGECVGLGVMWKGHGCRAGAAWLGPEEVGLRNEQRRARRREAARRRVGSAQAESLLWDWLDARLPQRPLWFLDMIAVTPESQHQGLGGALVTHGLVRARAAHCPAFLQTSLESNVMFYEAHGFRIVDEGSPPGGGPVIWFMQTSP
jgi:ribosomal protein S18 acetylase RimI-like enzyme